MNDKQLLTMYGLKWNPFLPNMPVEALWLPPHIESFLFRAENIVLDGGFAMISGEPGLGKSKILQMLANRLGRMEELTVGIMERPQSSLNDFYREMGVLFGMNLKPSNRYGSFKALRERWHAHIKSTLMHPVLLVDEAQEMGSACLNEIRLLGSTNFDSQCLLTTILCGDTRLPDRLRNKDLLSLGSRIRLRMNLEAHSRHDLIDWLEHVLKEAGGPHLMTKELKAALADHAAGNLRILSSMGAELLAQAAARQLPTIDEKLFLELYAKNTNLRRPRTSTQQNKEQALSLL